MKLRLLLWEECNRRCRGCCNKDWDLDAIPSCSNFDEYDEVMLTGGEPMLYPEKLFSIVREIRKQTGVDIYVYTAKVDDLGSALTVLEHVDGMTLTLHTKKDIALFQQFDAAIKSVGITGKKLRLNVFKNVSKFYTPSEDTLTRWKVKDNITWIKDCPLPANEVFARISG